MVSSYSWNNISSPKRVYSNSREEIIQHNFIFILFFRRWDCLLFLIFIFILFLREANSVHNLGQYKATYFYAKGCKNPSVLSAFLSQWGIVCTGSCIQNGVIGMKNEYNLRGNLVHLNGIHQKFFHSVLIVAWMTSFFQQWPVLGACDVSSQLTPDFRWCHNSEVPVGATDTPIRITTEIYFSTCSGKLVIGLTCGSCQYFPCWDYKNSCYPVIYFFSAYFYGFLVFVFLFHNYPWLSEN